MNEQEPLLLKGNPGTVLRISLDPSDTPLPDIGYTSPDAPIATYAVGDTIAPIIAGLPSSEKVADAFAEAVRITARIEENREIMSERKVALADVRTRIKELETLLSEYNRADTILAQTISIVDEKNDNLAADRAAIPKNIAALYGQASDSRLVRHRVEDLQQLGRDEDVRAWVIAYVKATYAGQLSTDELIETFSHLDIDSSHDKSIDLLTYMWTRDSSGLRGDQQRYLVIGTDARDAHMPPQPIVGVGYSSNFMLAGGIAHLQDAQQAYTLDAAMEVAAHSRPDLCVLQDMQQDTTIVDKVENFVYAVNVDEAIEQMERVVASLADGSHEQVVFVGNDTVRLCVAALGAQLEQSEVQLRDIAKSGSYVAQNKKPTEAQRRYRVASDLLIDITRSLYAASEEHPSEDMVFTQVATSESAEDPRMLINSDHAKEVVREALTHAAVHVAKIIATDAFISFDQDTNIIVRRRPFSILKNLLQRSGVQPGPEPFSILDEAHQELDRLYGSHFSAAYLGDLHSKKSLNFIHNELVRNVQHTLKQSIDMQQRDLDDVAGDAVVDRRPLRLNMQRMQSILTHLEQQRH